MQQTLTSVRALLALRSPSARLLLMPTRGQKSRAANNSHKKAAASKAASNKAAANSKKKAEQHKKDVKRKKEDDEKRKARILVPQLQSRRNRLHVMLPRFRAG